MGNKIHILEIGMGTGLNVVLTCLAALKRKQPVFFETLEPFPLSEEIIKGLNFSDLIASPDAKKIFSDIHLSDWEKEIFFPECFTLLKSRSKIQEYSKDGFFDLIYFDAFAPKKQPDMWSLEIFNKLFHMLRNRGCLVSYCASGQFKRDLRTAGFQVETLPGPPGKKEMTRAIKHIA